MRYTTVWTREKVRTAADYQRWLESLKDGGEVLLQQFHPAEGDSAVLGSPHEIWQFERVRVYGDQVHGRGDSHPIKRDTGKACYWDSAKDWGKVFPARLVPCHYDLPTEKVGDSVWGHHPVYEPLFFGCYRHTAIMRYGKGFSHLNMKALPEHYYWRKVERGELLIFFSDVEPEDLTLDAQVQYLYSEYLRG